MEFTIDEKKMIVCGLEDGFGHLEESIEGVMMFAQKGCKYKGEILERLLKMIEQYEAYLAIEGKIFETIDESSLKKEMLLGIEKQLNTVEAWKEALKVTEDDN